jgi:hypothetical protein
MDTQDHDPSDRKEKLRKAAERKAKRRDAQQWDHAPGEVLDGTYLGSVTLENDYGRTPLYFVESFDGEVYKVLGRTGLVMEMENEDPEEGDLISITYEGRKPSDTYDTDFYAYSVVVA